jgi:hypothetical protein
MAAARAKSDAPCRFAVPVDQRVGFPHRAQVRIRAKMSAVADRHAQAHPPRAGQDPPSAEARPSAGPPPWGDARAQPAGLGDLGLRQRIAQFVQRLAPECRPRNRPSRPTRGGIARPGRPDRPPSGAPWRASRGHGRRARSRPVRRHAGACGRTSAQISGCAVTIAGAVNLLLTSLSLSLISSAALRWMKSASAPAARGRGAGTKRFHPQDVVAGS